jgi:hypothetical protein
MSLQALPRRVASSPLIPAAKFNRLPTARVRPWPNLSPEVQTQIARILAELLRRMLPTHVEPGREIARADRREHR